MNFFHHKYSLLKWRDSFWLLATLIFVSPLLISCINEDFETSQESAEDSEMVTLNFSVQKTGASFGIGSTRAGGYEEGDISNLYVISVMTSYFNYNLEGVDPNEVKIDKDPNEKKYYEQPMTGVRNRVTVTPLNVYEFNSDFDVYTNYKLSLYPGRYRFYVVANCDMYVSDFYNANGSYTEQQIKEVVLNFSPDAPLRVAHLPMACEPKNIRHGLDSATAPKTDPDSDEVLNYTVPIYKESKDDKTKPDIIFADLTFQCSKVRYTILFDATQPTEDNNNYEGISVGFGNQSLRFYVDESTETNPRATKIRNSTDLFADVTKDLTNQNSFLKLTGENSEDLGFATWNLGLNRYEWPESGKDYPKYASDELIPWNANEGLDDWKARRKRAWQGIIYLPANDDGDKGIDHTVLEFPYVVDWYPEASEDGYYIDGQFDPKNFKSINLFGGNNNETHYNGGTSADNPYDDQKKPSAVSNGDGYSHGLERGKFYDVVALVRNPDEWDLETIVYGEIKDWHETDQNLEESGDIIKDGKEEKTEEVIPGISQNPWDYNGSEKEL